ncbi:MAG: FAD-dependent oxidoreductase, partial [Betaproteobacteria bacterium]|nr:FAD-dependent oxidoreductase [Betaproteobacteria bacterium]
MTQVLGLTHLEERIRQDLAQLCLPARPWIPAKELNGKPIKDVIIIGGGMAGLVLGAALKNLGIDAHLLDKSTAGFEGPWLTTARMETLRSPKELTGPALGIGSLTFQAWFVAQWGEEAWKVFDKIPRPQWAEYLRWYRKVLGIEVQNGHEVISVNPSPDQIVRVEVKDHNTHPATTY